MDISYESVSALLGLRVPDKVVRGVGLLGQLDGGLGALRAGPVGQLGLLRAAVADTAADMMASVAVVAERLEDVLLEGVRPRGDPALHRDAHGPRGGRGRGGHAHHSPGRLISLKTKSSAEKKRRKKNL